MAGTSSSHPHYKLTIVGCKTLLPADPDGNSDPYVKIADDFGHHFQTHPIENNLNPQWNESDNVEGYDINVTVYDHDLISSDDVLGHVRINLETQLNEVVEVPLTGKVDGKDNTGKFLYKAELLSDPPHWDPALPKPKRVLKAEKNRTMYSTMLTKLGPMVPHGAHMQLWYGEYELFGTKTDFHCMMEVAKGGTLRGVGEDEVAKFEINGTWAGGKVKFTKQYLGRHKIEYTGTLGDEGFTIKGTWEGQGAEGSFELKQYIP
ncbi:hypothetical protein Pelo_3644 [Pelomyxa schiedti]|nr:hypothetical protein Pelo_3644 [Pelomyxa schiedti]